MKSLHVFFQNLGVADPESLARRLDYAAFLTDDKRLLYVETPKCACSTMKHVMAAIDGKIVPSVHVGQETSLKMAVHNRAVHPTKGLSLLSPLEIKELFESDQVVRFCVVRNPYARLASAWSDKIRQCEPGYENAWRNILKYHGSLNSEEDMRCPEFHEFVHWVAHTQNLESCNIHWRSMRALLMPEVVNYTHVLRTESLKTGFQAVLDSIGGSKSAGEYLGKSKTNESLPINWKELYTQELADAVYGIYQKDFEFYGYEKNSWRGDESTITDAEEINRLKHRVSQLESAALAAIRDRNAVLKSLMQEKAVDEGGLSQAYKYRRIPDNANLTKSVTEAPNSSTSTRKPVWQLLTSLQGHPWIDHVIMDVVSKDVSQEGSFEFGGVVVLSNEAPDVLRLELRAGSDRLPIKWDIESPYMAKQYPDSKNSKNARWSVRCRLNFCQEKLHMVLIDEKGGELYLLEIALEEDKLPTSNENPILPQKKVEHSYNFESLLIVTYGRSGSTLLMGILNTITDTLIRGENNDLCRGLFDSYEALVDVNKSHPNEKESSTPFFGADSLSPAKFLEDARALLKRQLVSNESMPSIWGFKEIRWGAKEAQQQELKNYLDFMTQLMPSLGLIFLTRDLAQVAKSAWWEAMPESNVITNLTRFESICKAWSKERKDSFWIDYSDLGEISPRLRALFEWIGSPLDEERVFSILHTEHSYNNKPKTFHLN